MNFLGKLYIQSYSPRVILGNCFMPRRTNRCPSTALKAVSCVKKLESFPGIFGVKVYFFRGAGHKKAS